MFSHIYITKRNYVYNKKNCKMYKISPDVKEILMRYNTLDQLKEKNEKTYFQILPILEKINNGSQTEEKTERKGTVQLQLMVCNKCNLSCKYCYANAGTYNRPQETMTFETAKNAIDIFYKKYDKIDEIIFFGGEPLLCSNLIDQVCNYLFEHYNGRYSMLGIMSNLFKLSEKDIAIIRKHNIKVSTSVDGLGKLNGYRLTKSGQNSYEQVSSNIKALYKAVEQPEAIEITMSDLHSRCNYNAERLKEELAAHFSVKNFTVNPVEDFTGSMKNHLFSGEYQEPLNVDRYIDNGVCDMRINDLIAVIKGNNNSGYFCYAGITRFSIFPNGNIFPCQIYCLDKEDKFVMGNVNTFDEGYFNRKVNEISHMASKNSHEECKNCFSTSICSSCLGVCIVNQKRIPHEIEYCEKTKLYHEQLIEIYANLLSNPQRFEKFKKRLNETVALCKN